MLGGSYQQWQDTRSSFVPPVKAESIVSCLSNLSQTTSVAANSATEMKERDQEKAAIDTALSAFPQAPALPTPTVV